MSKFSVILISCIYSNKDKNFKANHNTSSTSAQQEKVVSIVTKIRILKQITTVLKSDAFISKLYL